MPTQSRDFVTIPSESLEQSCGGLSPGLAQRAYNIAAERHIDALNAGSPRADKLARQMLTFGSYGK